MKSDNKLIGEAGGTSGSHQRVRPEDIFNLSFKKFENEKLETFSHIIDDYLKKNSNNQSQILTLENLRDTLLPKLMSNTVKVNNFKE